MIVTGLCFVGMTGLVKSIAGRVPSIEAAFLRFAFGLVFLLPTWRLLITTQISPRLWRLIGLRGVVHTLGVMCWFYAMTRIPVAEVTALNYINPVLVTVLAVVLLGEPIALRRIVAIAVALVGALVILRPGFRTLDPGHFSMLGTGVAMGASYLIMKILSGELPAALVVMMMSLTVTLGLTPFALAVWVTPDLSDLVVLVAIAFLATAGHYSMTLAFAAAPLSVTQPVTFLQLVWSVMVGAIFFGEPVDPFVIAGGTLVIGAVSYMTWREAMLRKKVTPAVNQPKL
ncbi:MAG: DMT family transporter [Roseivivax sp.]|nr:DMT family transporter [Roseivivax sp.]